MFKVMMEITTAIRVKHVFSGLTLICHLFSPAATASGTGDQEAAGARAEEEVRGDGAAPQGGGA